MFTCQRVTKHGNEQTQGDLTIAAGEGREGRRLFCGKVSSKALEPASVNPKT